MYRLIPATILLTFIIINGSAQAPGRPIWGDSVYCEGRGTGYHCAPVCIGNLILKKGDTLRNCYMRIWPRYTWVQVPSGFNKNIIFNLDIKLIQTDRPIFGRTNSEFIHLDTINHYDFWRLIKKQGVAAIYDRVEKETFTRLFSWKMVLMVGNRRPIWIYRIGPFSNDQYRHTRKLLSFINKHYHQHFDSGHFKSEWEMIDYILDQENHP